ncbi:MAG TPA: response regulator [Terriglobia bacterium]|nr:response regulator [Terriglobia bacterium]
MAKDDRDVLEVLKAELDFVEKGGYGRSVRTPWKPTEIFRDSPACINFDDPKLTRPCEDCLLMEFVPPDKRGEQLPCHRIPLNERGETVESLAAQQKQPDLEEAVTVWLREAIGRIEEARAATHSTEGGSWWQAPPSESGRKRVLVVDDDERVLIALEALLETEGYDTTTAWSGREALRLLRSGGFDLVLLDDFLGDVTSEEILRQLMKVSARIPVLVMQTAGLSDDAAARYARLGAHYFVSKGQPEEVASVVRDYLTHSKALPTYA